MYKKISVVLLALTISAVSAFAQTTAQTRSAADHKDGIWHPIWRSIPSLFFLT